MCFIIYSQLCSCIMYKITTIYVYFNDFSLISALVMIRPFLVVAWWQRLLLVIWWSGRKWWFSPLKTLMRRYDHWWWQHQNEDCTSGSTDGYDGLLVDTVLVEAARWWKFYFELTENSWISGCKGWGVFWSTDDPIKIATIWLEYGVLNVINPYWNLALLRDLRLHTMDIKT